MMTFLTVMGVIGGACAFVMVWLGFVIEYAHRNQGDE